MSVTTPLNKQQIEAAIRITKEQPQRVDDHRFLFNQIDRNIQALDVALDATTAIAVADTATATRAATNASVQATAAQATASSAASAAANANAAATAAMELATPKGGPTHLRPIAPPDNTVYCDTDLNKPVFFFAGKWRDSGGSPV